MITVNLGVRIHNKVVLENISCALIPGRITLFIGKSGAGKTTLLKSLAGLIAIDQGSIISDNKQLDLKRWQEVGYVFQDFNLFPHLSVVQNCIDPLMVHGISYDNAQQRALEVLTLLEMQSYRDAYVRELSGGQQQRVAIARALCLNPGTLLLDEPTASLDPFNTDILVAILKKLASQGLIIALSSQDMSFVKKLFDRVYYLQSGTIVELCDDMHMINSCPLIAQFIKQH